MSISALRDPAGVDHDDGSANTLRRRAVTLVKGRPQDPRWVRPVLYAILVAAAFLAFWHLRRNGWSNEYYAAAARSGSLSWKAWFFGSIDPGSFITVDKPPLSLWAMGLSVRVFGWSSFAMLLPQALFTVGSVALMNATVRRLFGPTAGLIAAAALATTPVIISVGRVNNPDALLILLLIASAWLAVRAIETGKTKFLLWCGAVVGLAFMTKMLEGWMVVPALAGAYLFAGPPKLLTRVRQLALAGASMVVVSAAWPVAVTLWPGSKPYIGGSENGSIWNLILGYNGFGRITGSEGGMGGGGASFGGSAGLWRMFNDQVGGQIAWLLPLAGVSIVAGLWLTRRAPRVDRTRAGIILFGLWTIVLAAVFSSQKGIFHPYYVSALAPGVAALTGGGLVLLVGWARRSWVGLAVIDATVAGTAWLSVDLLNRTPDFAPALRTIVPIAAGVAILASVALRLPSSRSRFALAVAAVAATVALGAGPTAYSIATTTRTLDGNNVIAGPAAAAQGGFGGGGGGGRGGFGGGTPPAGATGTPPAQAQSGSTSSSSVGSLFGSDTTQGGDGGGAPTGGGGMGGGSSVSSELISYLEAHQGTAKYLVAATGSSTTAPIIIATGKPVVTIGGFSGSDPAPTVAELQEMVSKGELKYVLLGSGGGGGGRGGSSDITQWVQEHGTAVSGITTSGGTLYAVTA
jgi:4-amino-4-deoxy-L-arabinose transferase-like glycosyltransferase